jgi:hypothetical protein
MASVILIGLGCLGLALCYSPFRLRFELLLAWIVEPWPVWFGALSALVVMMLFRNSYADHARAFVHAGLLLQMVGIGAVALGISRKLSVLEKPDLRTWIGRWLRQMLGIVMPTRHNVFVPVTGVVSFAGAGGMAVAVGRKAPTTIQEQLDELKADIVRLDGELKSTKAALKKEQSARIEAIDQEHSYSATRFKEIRDMIERVTVGTFHEEIVGLVWLIISAVCTTLSVDIASQW